MAIYRNVVSILQKRGFSLVELMVVVAIIGILSAVAVPNFKKYQAKSRASEAPVQLAAIYTVESTAKNEYDTYGTCLDALGYNPSAEKASRYFTVGFGAIGTQNDEISAAGNAPCGPVTAGEGKTFFEGTKPIGSRGARGSTAPATSATVESAAFTAAADGHISSDSGTVSNWTINHTKQITNNTLGY